MIIVSVEPKAGKVGDEILISGSALNVGPAKSAGVGSVTFNGVKADVVEWLHDKVRVTIPKDAVSGPLCVAFSGDAVEVPFEVYAESGEERNERLAKADEEAKAAETKKAADDKKAAADLKKAEEKK